MSRREIELETPRFMALNTDGIRGGPSHPSGCRTPTPMSPAGTPPTILLTSHRRSATGDEMDLTLPYTFYPLALPHWIAWTLFLSAILSGAGVGIVQVVRRGWPRGLRAGALGTVGFLAVTMVASMVITFFVHDI